MVWSVFSRAVVTALLLAACFRQGHAQSAPAEAEKATPSEGVAKFDWFEYRGDDELFKKPLKEDEYRNPILAGYYPDPSVTVVGQDHYMVNSTFGFYPGVPVFHSRDLVNWTQLGNAIDRPDMMPFDGKKLGNHGIYAATIEHHAGTFYIMTTCVACGGNFVIKATDPAGPWSDPIWLPHLPGIDPSLFIDDDGRFYVVHHRDADERRYPGHTEVRVMEVDPETFAALSEDVLLVDGGDQTPWNTIYLEGPHLYKHEGKYVLSAPGGGTGYTHQQLAFRSDEVFGPYEAFQGNPILTQWGLPDGRQDPVTATGHADIFQDANGDWWAVFLGTRVYDLDVPPQDPGRFHTGRETFLLPVSWEGGWPIILKPGEAVPMIADRPNLTPTSPKGPPTTGNYVRRENFDDPTLGFDWLFIRTPKERWWDMSGGQLHLTPRADRIGDSEQPSFIGKRLAHLKASAATELTFSPQTPADEAGLLALQNDGNYFTFALSLNEAGERILRVRHRVGWEGDARGRVLAERSVGGGEGSPVTLKLEIETDEISFSYSQGEQPFETLVNKASSKNLTTARAGGFTGAVIGPYAETAD